MKTLITAAAAAILLTLSVFQPAAAQHPAGANAPKFGIAVVDIGYVFKNHAKFKAATESMKKDMEGIEQQLKGKRDQVAQAEQQLGTLKAGSPDYKALDERLARMKADFNLEMTRLRKDLIEREAKVYYQTFKEIEQTVKYYATRQNIGLVLRFNGETADPARREDVLKEINKPVVFENSIDITADVVSLVNRGGAPRAAAQGAAAPR